MNQLFPQGFAPYGVTVLLVLLLVSLWRPKVAAWILGTILLALLLLRWRDLYSLFFGGVTQ